MQLDTVFTLQGSQSGKDVSNRDTGELRGGRHNPVFSEDVRECFWQEKSQLGKRQLERWNAFWFFWKNGCQDNGVKGH